LAVIGNGVVFDPQAFLDEVGRLKGQGVEVARKTCVWPRTLSH